MGRRHAASQFDEQAIVAGLIRADNEAARRALRRHLAWRQAVEAGAGSKTQRMLRRSWERARDDALVALALETLGALSSPSRPRRASRAFSRT